MRNIFIGLAIMALLGGCAGSFEGYEVEESIIVGSSNAAVIARVVAADTEGQTLTVSVPVQWSDDDIPQALKQTVLESLKVPHTVELTGKGVNLSGSITSGDEVNAIVSMEAYELAYAHRTSEPSADGRTQNSVFYGVIQVAIPRELVDLE